MHPVPRRVIIRIITFLIVFIYIGYISYHELPRMDFWVIMLFFAIYLTWTLLSESLVYQDPDTYVIKDDDRKTYLLLTIIYFGGLLYSAVDFTGIHWTRIYELEPGVILTGFIIFIISMPIRWIAHRELGKYFNHRVAVYEEHILVTSGIYSKIRHPIYLSNLLSFIGLPLIFSSWGGLLIMFAAGLPAIIYRIGIEEEFMVDHFGDKYRKYVDKSYKIIPGVW